MTEKKIYPLDRKKNLYLKHTKTKGRGLFCTARIRAGEELEATPSLILVERAHEHIENTLLRDYVFKVGKISKKMRTQLGIKDMDAVSCVVMGIASFCNHDEEPNAEVAWEERDGTLYHVLRATQNIAKDTEICTSYGEGWFDDRKE